MSNLLKFGFLILMSLSVIACTEDNSLTDDETITAQDYGSKSSCVTLLFPVSVTIAGEEIIAESKKDIKSALKAYKEMNPDSTKPDVHLVFPVEVMDSEDETLIVDTEEELEALKAECPESNRGGNRGGDRGGDRGNRGERTPCFDIVFPLTYVLSDSTTITGETKSEIKEQIKAWKSENEDLKPNPKLQFPIQVTTEEGEVLEIESKEALKQLRADC